LNDNNIEAKGLLEKEFPSYDSAVITGILANTSWKQQVIDAGVQAEIAADGNVLKGLGVIKNMPDLTKHINNTFVNKSLESGCN
jgi:hypothetical protein